MNLEIQTLDESLESRLNRANHISRSIHGNKLVIYSPGMFVVHGVRGKYRAISITGDRCELSCEHCKGALLKTMPSATTPQALEKAAILAQSRGDKGILITGGCDSMGALPWPDFLDSIRWIKDNSDLMVTVHAGQVKERTALGLKAAGVDQALVDIIGDEDTARNVYHLPQGVSSVSKSLDALFSAGLEVAPHIVCGLNYGKMSGEYQALETLARYPFCRYIVVVLTPNRATPMGSVNPPSPEDVALFIAEARVRLPEMEASLGCARPRGRYGATLDTLAVLGGVNSIALASDMSQNKALSMGLNIEYRDTCCSIGSLTGRGKS
jgi:hypothetical protein